MNLEYILDNTILYEKYAEFLMNNQSDRIICNGDTLLGAMEDGILLKEFKESIFDNLFPA